MSKTKRLFGDLIAAAISILIFASWFALPFDAEASVPTAPRYTPPADGAGRIETDETESETGIDTPETEMPEKRPENASEAISASYEQVSGKLNDEEIVKVLPEAEPIIETDLDALIVQVAAEYGLPWELVRAVCWVESGLDPDAISGTGDYGIMQVSYINHGWLGLADPLDPEQNLRAGCTILKTALDNSDGDLTRALMRYNRGDAYAMSQWSQGIFSTAYTEKVLERYYAYLSGAITGKRKDEKNDSRN